MYQLNNIYYIGYVDTWPKLYYSIAKKSVHYRTKQSIINKR